MSDFDAASAIRAAGPTVRQRVRRCRRRAGRGHSAPPFQRLWAVGAQHPRREGRNSRPAPQEADAFRWDDEARRLVADRISTQLVGDPATVADQLEIVRTATDADELMIASIIHDHTDRVRSYQLLAEEWLRRTGR